MATVDFIHFCEYACLDSHGRACLIGIIGSLSAEAFPHSRAQLTVAIGLRIPAGERGYIRVEIGPEDSSQTMRATLFDVEGPPVSSGQRDALRFLPFATVMLYFDRPHTMVARVIEGDVVLATKTLAISLRQPNTDPHR